MSADDTTAADIERIALEHGKAQLTAGAPPAEILEGLARAEALIAASREVCCDFCDEPITGIPVRDPVSASWLPAGGQVFCSEACLVDWDNHQVEAAGNEPS